MACTAFYKLLPVQRTPSCSQRTIKLTIESMSCFQSSTLTRLLRDCTSVEAITTDSRRRPPGKDHWCKPSLIRPLGILGQRLMSGQRKNNLESVIDIPLHSYPLLGITHKKYTFAPSNPCQSSQNRNYSAYYHNDEGTVSENKNNSVPEIKMQLHSVWAPASWQASQDGRSRRHTAMDLRGNLITLQLLSNSA